MSYACTILQGRFGNQFYQIATLIAYAKKHRFTYHVPKEASNCDNVAYFQNFPNFRIPRAEYFEPLNENNLPFYSEIPRLDAVKLVGYWQSFKYFNDYRNDVLEAFNFEYNYLADQVSIHVRRGDYVIHADAFPPLPMEYYKIAIDYFNKLGYKNFIVFSDDMNLCKGFFTESIFPNSKFTFSENKTEIEDVSLMSSCAHNIVANSSFSYAASWLNKNPDKIVVSPSYKNMFKGANLDMIPSDYLIVNLEEKVVHK